jgi:hypothetical protein
MGLEMGLAVDECLAVAFEIGALTLSASVLSIEANKKYTRSRL